MIAIAIFLVWQGGMDALPCIYEHEWLTEDLTHALLELLEVQTAIEYAYHWSMLCVKVWVEDSSDIDQ